MSDAGTTEKETTPVRSKLEPLSKNVARTPISHRVTQSVPLTISILSILIAAASAFFAYEASKDAYVSDRRSELIDVVAQLNVSVQNGELEEESAFLIAQAIWLTETVPDVPAVVYRQIAEAIVIETPVDKENALPLLEEAMKRAGADNNEYEQVSVLQVRAGIYEDQGELERMRDDYETAVQLSAAYDGPNLLRQHAVPAFTHVYWGRAEVRAGECAAAVEQLSAAREHASFVTHTILEEWMTGLDEQIAGCSQ